MPVSRSAIRGLGGGRLTAGVVDTAEQSAGSGTEACRAALPLEGLAADDDPIPEPTGPGVYIEQHAAAAA